MAEIIKKHLFLPDVIGNIAIPKVGYWEDSGASIIIQISDGIAISEGVETHGVSSIPDVWGRPLMFQSALKLGAKDPLSKRCVQEWRGLLSLLALWKYKGYELEFVPINLDEGPFSKALINLAPKAIELEKGIKYDWKDILLIRFNGIPIGAFSPTTLVYTATQYNLKLKNEPIFLQDRQGYLRPPENEDEIEEMEFVGEWLFNLQKKFNEVRYKEQKNEDNVGILNVIDKIAGLLNEWLREINEKLDPLGRRERERDGIDSHKVKIAGENFPLTATHFNKYNIYQALLRPLLTLQRHIDYPNFSFFFRCEM